jgi:FKBP-type peptidyl-prolyl cis-trans isomerase FklB
MRRGALIALVVGSSLSCPLHAAPAENPAASTDETFKDSYSLGYEFAEKLRGQTVPVQTEVVIQAVRDALEGKPPAIGHDQMDETLAQLRKKAFVLHSRRLEDRASKNLAEAGAFLAKNGSETGITTLADGLQFRILAAGQGQSPTLGDRVHVRYRGTLLDGTEFDTSDAHGGALTIPVGGVIRGWTEALQLMQPGAKWQIFVPPDLGYGARPFGRIPPNSMLVFDLELLAIAEGVESSAPTSPGAAEPPRLSDE